MHFLIKKALKVLLESWVINHSTNIISTFMLLSLTCWLFNFFIFIYLLENSRVIAIAIFLILSLVVLFWIFKLHRCIIWLLLLYIIRLILKYWSFCFIIYFLNIKVKSLAFAWLSITRWYVSAFWIINIQLGL